MTVNVNRNEDPFAEPHVAARLAALEAAPGGGGSPLSDAAAMLLTGTQAGRPAASAANANFYYYATDTNGGTLYQSDGAAWNQLTRGLNQAPTGGAGGDLSGSYPNPAVAAGAITDSKVAAANKDGAAGTASMRTLGTGAAQAAAGNDARFTPPTGTGLRHVTAGVEDGASHLLTDADVDAAAAIALSKLAEPVLQADGGQALTGDLPAGAHKVTNLADPTAGQDAATKTYVDAVATGLDVKASCRLATAAALPANVYANGASGVGATITGVSVGALSVDGTTPGVGDRVLVKNEGTASHNGPYTVTTVGSGVAVFVLTRSTDADQAAEFSEGDFVFIEEGTANAATGWVLTSPGPFTIGTTALTFAQFSAIAQAHAASHKSGGSDSVAGVQNGFAPLSSSLLVPVSYLPFPTGTGFRHMAAGVEDAASKLVDTADVTAKAITYAKVQDVSATARILGRTTAGAGVIEELTGAQALAIAGASANPHGAADHTDITRSIWVASGMMTSDAATFTAYGALPDGTKIQQLADAATQGVYLPIGIPSDAVASQPLNIRIMWIPASTDATAHTVRWSVNAKSIVAGTDITAAGTTTAFTGSSAARTANQMVAEASTQILASVSAYDWIRLSLRRLGADAADTYVGAVGVVGIFLDYTATQ